MDNHEGQNQDIDGVEAVQVTEESTITLNDTENPPLKRFKHLDQVSELLQKKEDKEKEAESTTDDKRGGRD